MRAMSANRREVIQLSVLAASALALPAMADTRPLEPMRLLILDGTGFIGPEVAHGVFTMREDAPAVRKTTMPHNSPPSGSGG
jgi:hypothetical protein